MKKKDKIVMDQYAIGEIKAVEPSEELPKYKFKKWEEYYTKAVDCIEEHYPNKNRQWCHDQLNRALDNTEFHNLDTDAFDSDQNYELKCQMIDEILYGEFDIRDKQETLSFIEQTIFGENLRGGLLDQFYDNYVVDMDGGDTSPNQHFELDDLQEQLSKWIMTHVMQNGGRIKMDGKDENPYLDWSEDSIGDELFELKEHIVDRFLNCDDDVELLRNQELKTKYDLLQDAMEKLNETDDCPDKTKKVTKSSKILSGRDKVIIEMQIEYDVPQGLSYAEKVQFTEDLELPTGYVEDSFGIVEFSNKKESN